MCSSTSRARSAHADDGSQRRSASCAAADATSTRPRPSAARARWTRAGPASPTAPVVSRRFGYDLRRVKGIAEQTTAEQGFQSAFGSEGNVDAKTGEFGFGCVEESKRSWEITATGRDRGEVVPAHGSAGPVPREIVFVDSISRITLGGLETTERLVPSGSGLQSPTEFERLVVSTMERNRAGRRWERVEVTAEHAQHASPLHPQCWMMRRGEALLSIVEVRYGCVAVAGESVDERSAEEHVGQRLCVTRFLLERGCRVDGPTEGHHGFIEAELESQADAKGP